MSTVEIGVIYSVEIGVIYGVDIGGSNDPRILHSQF
jgi:hypothetical protein